MRVVFCGRKAHSVYALQHITDKLGWEVLLVIVPDSPEPAWIPSPRLGEYARNLGIEVATQGEAQNHIQRNFMAESGFSLKNTDLLISYLFPHRITEPLLGLPKAGCINFHPAPLPEFAGLGGYNYAILKECSQYGCTAHFMDANFDTGDIIKVRRMEMDSTTDTALSLEERTRAEMLLLFKEVCNKIDRGEALPRSKQKGVHSVTRREFEEARRIQPEDDDEIIERKIRAFWYPPYSGATYGLNGKSYTLVSDDILYSLGFQLHKRLPHL